MTERDPKPNQPLAFDQMELHSDVAIERPKRPPVRRNPKSSTGWLVLLLLLFLGAAGAAGYFYMQHQDLNQKYALLLTSKELTTQDLNQTSGSLEQAGAKLRDLETRNTALTKEKDDLNKKVKALNTTIQNQKSQLDDRQKESQKYQDQLQTSTAQLQKVKEERDTIRSDFNRHKETAEEQQQAATTRFENAQLQYQSQLANMTQAQETLEGKLRAAASEKKRLETQFAEESKASMEIIRERGALKNENTQLNAKLRKLEADLAAAEKLVRDGRETTYGELIPFSDQVQGSRPTYKEPFPDGVRIPKKPGLVIVQVLISEVGAVENAYLLPDQQLEGGVGPALIRTMYKWKFTPPVYQGVKVKAWQPILVTAP